MLLFVLLLFYLFIPCSVVSISHFRLFSLLYYAFPCFSPHALLIGFSFLIFFFCLMYLSLILALVHCLTFSVFYHAHAINIFSLIIPLLVISPPNFISFVSFQIYLLQFVFVSDLVYCFTFYIFYYSFATNIFFAFIIRLLLIFLFYFISFQIYLLPFLPLRFSFRSLFDFFFIF